MYMLTINYIYCKIKLWYICFFNKTKNTVKGEYRMRIIVETSKFNKIVEMVNNVNY